MKQGFLLSLILGASVQAGDVLVTTNPLAEVKGRPVTITAQRLGDVSQTQSLSVIAGGAATFELPQGNWLLTSATPGIWSPRTIIEIGESTKTHVNLPLLAAVAVHARMAFPASPRRIPEIKLYFQPSSEEYAQALAGEHIALGRVDGNGVDFDLPVGRFDLAFRVDGYASLYRWDRNIAERTDLGTLQFKPGTTISGRIDVGSLPKGDLKKILVTLRPFEAQPLNESHEKKAVLRQRTTQPTRRGFFQFDVLPGAYIVDAAAGRHRSEEQLITALEDKEALLVEPLRLEELRSLEVRVVPILDPTGKPWRVTLSAPPARDTFRLVSNNGTATFNDLFPHSYQLTVGRGEGSDAWHSEIADPRAVASLAISIPLVRIRGEVLMGTRPLSDARLSFIDEGRIIRVWSRAGGRFAVDLPLQDTSGVWSEVEIESEEPFVRAAVKNVPIEDAEMAIALSTRTITGDVVDESGRRTPSIVNVQTSTRTFQIDSNDGTFSVLSLPAGPVSLSAFSSEGETNGAVRIEMPEDVETHTTTVRLILEESGYLYGLVRAAYGPLTGAVVWCAPTPFVATIARIPTDVDGTFRFSRARGVQRMTCTISAPGFASRLMRVPAHQDEPLEILVRQSGASLVVRPPADLDGRGPYLLHDGAVIHLRVFAYLAASRMLGDQMSFYVEEGDWSLCMWNDAEVLAGENGGPMMQRCKTVRANAGGSAELKF